MVDDSISEIRMTDQSNFASEEPMQIDSTQKLPCLDESMYPNEVHPRVQCDGCGMFPIVGVRYKCSVLKDFDYCEKCEATKEHKYAFLKIKRASDAPQAIFTTIDDSKHMENAKADIDIDIQNPQDLLRQFFGAFGRDPQSAPPTANSSRQPQA